MSHVIVGHCPKCGAPIYVQSPWWAIVPPPNVYSCACFPQPQAETSATIKLYPDSESAKPSSPNEYEHASQ